MDDKRYEDTVSESKEDSILKAISFLEAENKRFSERTVSRPNISVCKTLCKHLLIVCAYVMISFAVLVLLKHFEVGKLLLVLIPIVLGLLFFLLNFKSICVDFVLLYQKLAPEKLRRSCLFEPSCSEYMLLAIEKYGVFKGVIKGIKRLIRCHHPNGGVDYP